MLQMLSKDQIDAIENSNNQDDLTRRQREFFAWRRRRLQAKNKELLDFVKKEIQQGESLPQALLEFVPEK